MRVERIQPDRRQAEGTANSLDFTEQQRLKTQEPLANSLFPAAKDEETNKTALDSVENKKALEEKLEQLNKTVEIFDKKIHFQIHDETNRIMVKVIETETDEVITEIPPEKILDMMARIEETLGLLVDKKL